MFRDVTVKDIKVQDIGFGILRWVLIDFRGRKEYTTKTEHLLYAKVWASLVAQLAKNLPAFREIWVRSLGWEDPLEKGKATHSSTRAWRILWTV